MTNDLVCGFFSISETVLSGSHIASSSARVSACLELAQQLRQLGDIRRDPAGLIAREATSPLGHRLGLIFLMDGAAPPLPFQFAPLSCSRPKQLG